VPSSFVIRFGNVAASSLNRLAAAVDSFEGDEHQIGRIRRLAQRNGRSSGERTRSVESSYVPTLDAARWRTATLVASAVATVELALLLAIGVTVLGKSVAHRVQEAAVAKVAGVPAIPKPTPPGAPKLPRGQTDVLVLNGSGVAGAAGTAADVVRNRGYQISSVGNARRQSSSTRTLVMYRRGYRAEAARLARDLHAKIFTPLDGMRRSTLMGAQLVLVVGR